MQDKCVVPRKLYFFFPSPQRHSYYLFDELKHLNSGQARKLRSEVNCCFGSFWVFALLFTRKRRRTRKITLGNKIHFLLLILHERHVVTWLDQQNLRGNCRFETDTWRDRKIHIFDSIWLIARTCHQFFMYSQHRFCPFPHHLKWHPQNDNFDLPDAKQIVRPTPINQNVTADVTGTQPIPNPFPNHS